MRSAWPCLPSPKSRMGVRIGDPGVWALRVGTGEALGVHPSGALPDGFSSHAKVAQAQGLALHPTSEWRQDDRRGSQVGCVA
jgi:hypothetical protein